MKGKGRADGRTVSSKVVAAEEAAKREAELRAMFVVVPPGDEAKPISCPICKEPLKSEFLEDDEEWVWRNAIKKDDRVSRCVLSSSSSTIETDFFVPRFTMRRVTRRRPRRSRVLRCVCGTNRRVVAGRGPLRKRRPRKSKTAIRGSQRRQRLRGSPV